MGRCLLVGYRKYTQDKIVCCIMYAKLSLIRKMDKVLYKKGVQCSLPDLCIGVMQADLAKNMGHIVVR